MSEPESPPPDFDRLNQQFYACPPYTYFHQRLDNLIAVAGEDEGLSARLRERIEVGSFAAWTDDDEKVPSALTPEARRDFITAETVVLAHHTYETLLRLYLAHATLGPCPWLEMSRLRTPGEFRGALNREFLDVRRPGARHESIVALFLGSREVTSAAGLDVDAIADNLDRFLVHFADAYTTDANAYNAAKHGLAVNASAASLVVTDDSTGEPVLGRSGPSLCFLERMPGDEKGEYIWQMTTRWVDVVYEWSLINAALLMMSSLWNVAMVRYAEGTHEGVVVWTPADENPLSLRQGLPLTGSMTRFSIRVGVERKR